MIQSNTRVDINEINSIAVAAIGRPAIYISNNLDFNLKKDRIAWNFLISAIAEKYGEKSDVYKTIAILSGFMFFDDLTELHDFYTLFEHPLIDSGGAYACTYNKFGVMLTENT